MITRKELEEREHGSLSPYACFSDSAEREIEISEHDFRTRFQRDRDRIIHSKTFRRLEYKTQVYLTEFPNDHFRTRLTHTIEVSQIARTIAVQLGGNVDLVEAISLGHDVGHTPFGHAGQNKLDELLKKYSDDNIYFKHNIQSVKVLKILEKKYDYDGVNLTIPTLEGILKHTSIPSLKLPYFCDNLYPNINHSITIEGQIVAAADEIAQITHDTDDYLRNDVLSLEDFRNHDIFKEVNIRYREGNKENINTYLNRIHDNETKKSILIRCLVDYLVLALINESSKILTSTTYLK